MLARLANGGGILDVEPGLKEGMVQRRLGAQKLGRVTDENSSAALKIGDNRPAEITILAMDASRLFPLGVLRTL
jgi:hypothetical protein